MPLVSVTGFYTKDGLNVAAGTVVLNIICEGLCSFNDEEVTFYKKSIQYPVETRLQKQYPIYDRHGQNRYPIYDQNGSKIVLFEAAHI